MNVQTFIEDFKKKNITNSKLNPTAVFDYISETLKVKTYIPFLTKRQIVETVVSKNIKVVDGIKKCDNINQYISFVVAMLVSHTNIEIGDPYEDYDLLCESKLLMPIMETFKADYDECDVLLKMALASELEDNDVNVLIGNFLNDITKNIGSFSGLLKEKFESLNINELLGDNVNSENLTNIFSLFNK